MKRPKSSKIYIQVGGRLYDFMWANVGPDDSVMMGFRFEGRQQIELVIDQVRGELRTQDIEAPFHISQGKISFHSSGHYKLDVQMGVNPCAIDRSTVIGPRLADIDMPRRMSDILFPERLPLAQGQPTNRDIVLDASDAPRTPMVCTISCVSNNNYGLFNRPEAKVIGNSTWETSQALTSGAHTWVWTLHTSPQHTLYPNRFIVCLYGEVRWGRRGIWRFTGWWGKPLAAVICSIILMISNLIKRITT